VGGRRGTIPVLGLGLGFQLATALAVPTQHDYFAPCPYRLAAAMIRLFERLDRRAMLAQSVKVNLVPTPSTVGFAASWRAWAGRCSSTSCARWLPRAS